MLLHALHDSYDFQFLSPTARSILLNNFVVWNVFFVFVSCWLHDVIRLRIHSFIAFIDPSKLLLSHFSPRFLINNIGRSSASAHTQRVNGIWRSWSWLKYQFIKHSFILIHHRSLYFFPKWKNINNNYRFFGFCFLCAPSADRYNARSEQRIEYICCIGLRVLNFDGVSRWKTEIEKFVWIDLSEISLSEMLLCACHAMALPLIKTMREWEQKEESERTRFE